MSVLLRVAAAILALAIATSGTGCVTEQGGTSNPTINSATTNTATPVSSPTSNATKTTTNTAFITLPLLDAFLHDDTFTAELKTKLQLTDEQIARLRTMARTETGKLRETDADDYAGTTSAARARADEQIASIIGEEKTRQLTTLVSEKWSAADDDRSNASNANQGSTTDASGSNAAHAAGPRPNAVPTDTRIVVNAPAYRMDVFEGGRLIKTYKIGIGYPEFPLPTGKRKASSIIFNPTWTPPDEPWVEATGKVKPGQKVEAGSKLNPLGPIKIPIGLPSLIHGGKPASKLGGFASHGCVGMTTPQVQEFAGTLAQLAGTELTRDEITAHAKTPKETKEVKLARPITVELRYETIVVEDGRLHIYRDVYDRDTNTEENLRAVLAVYNVTFEQLSEAEREAVLKALNEMARDASGRVDEPQTAANANTARNANDARAGNDDSRNARGETKNNAQVTRTVKGKKEVVIEIAALKGKGYPVPAAASPGGASKK